MNSLLYITKRSFINNLKKYIKKPTTLLIIVFAGFYIVSMYYSLTEFINEADSMLVNRYLTFALMIFLVLANFTVGINTIAKHRSVLFNTADVHFAFSAPISPKAVLLYAYSRSIILNILMDLVLLFLGFQVMKFPIDTLILMFVGNVLMIVCQTSLVIIVYGKHGESNISKYVRYFVRAILIFLVGYLLFQYFVMNIGLDITELMNDPFIFLLPLVGWGMSLFYVIFIQSTMITVVGSLLFVISTLGLVFYAWRLSSQGEFYEEASNFAEEYAKIKQRAKRGDMKQIGWKKRKLRKASIEYKGTGAKALLYRQILEYKKQRFFIFGFKSLMNLVISTVVAYLIYTVPEIVDMDLPLPLMFVGIMTYVSFLSSSYPTKWTKEIDIIYTFLIPDTAFKKLWYSTIIEHIRALVDGIMIVLPTAIIGQFTIPEIIGCIGVYLVLESTKLYMQIITQTILRSMIGKNIASFLQIIIQSLVYLSAFLLSSVFITKGNIAMALYAIVTFGIIVTIVFCALASGQFERMESEE